jgi:hypothetical protein
MTKPVKPTAKPVTRAIKFRTQPTQSAPKTKLGRLESMLRRKEGATIGQLAKALDWQLHKPYTRDGLQSVLWQLTSRLEYLGLVEPGLCFHGLRHR